MHRQSTDAAPTEQGPEPIVVPLRSGELRLRQDGAAISVEAWTKYSDGHAMMAGGLRLDAQELRILLHAVKRMVWRCEREGRAQ